MYKKVVLSVIALLCFQIASAGDGVFVYTLKDKNEVVYCGITNNPEARALEHVRDHTMRFNVFDTMSVIDGPMSRQQAYQAETKCINSHAIPKLYQARNPTERANNYQKITAYESRIDAKQLVQTSNPRVEYALANEKYYGDDGDDYDYDNDDNSGYYTRHDYDYDDNHDYYVNDYGY